MSDALRCERCQRVFQDGDSAYVQVWTVKKINGTRVDTAQREVLLCEGCAK